MNKLRFFLSAICVFYILPLFAQQSNEAFQLSEPFSDDAGKHYNFVLSDNTIIHLDLVSSQEKKITITKTDANNLITDTRDLYRDSRHPILIIRKLGDKIYMISNGSRDFFLNVIDPVAMTVSETVPLGMDLNNMANYYRNDFSNKSCLTCAMSPNGSKMMVYCRDGKYELTNNVQNRTFCFAVFEETSEKPIVMYHTFSAPSKLHALDISVDNSGYPVFLLKTREKEQSDNLICSYSILCIRNTTVQSDVLNSPSNDIVAMKFAGIRDDNWVVAGYASSDNSDVADLMIVGEINNSAVDWSIHPMTDEYVSSYNTKAKQFGQLKDGSLGFTGIHPEAAFLGKDGSVSLLSLLNEEKLDNMGIKNDDILIFSFTAHNEFSWTDRIPYRQYYSVDCIVNGSQLYVLHFNQPENLTLSKSTGPDETPRKEQCKVILSIFDMNGERRRDILLNVPISSIATNLRFGEQLVGMATINKSVLKDNDTVLVTFELPDD